MTTIGFLFLTLLLAGCQGLSGTVGGNVPPDPALAASPEFAMEFTNSGYLGFNASTGKYVDLRPDVLEAAGGDNRVYWGDWQQRFALVGIHSNPFHFRLGVDVNITQSADPTAAVWQPMWWGQDRTVNQPSLALAQNLAVVADRLGGIWANTVTNMAFGVGQTPWTFGMTGIEGYAAHSRDSDMPYAYVVSANPNQSKLYLQRFDAGLGQKQATVDATSYGIGQIREGTTVLTQNVPGGITDAVVLAGGHHLLVTVSTTVGTDDCVRVLDYYDVGAATFAPTLQGHTDFCLTGQDAWSGSLGQALNGDVWVLAGCSGPSLPLSLCTQRWNGPQGTQQLGIKKAGAAFGTLAAQGRLGDYTTLAVDYGDVRKLIAAGQIAGTMPAVWNTWIDLVP